MRLENWSIIQDDSDPYKAPEIRKQLLVGDVYGSAKFKDGKTIQVSRVIASNGINIVVTNSGNKYKLGEVDPEYLKAYPNAKQRLINSLPTENN